MGCEQSVIRFACGLTYKAIMIGMSVFKKLALLAALMSFLTLALAQTSGDTIGPITSALREREFDKALQLLQTALLKSPQSAQLWTLQGIAFSGAEREKEALASFRNALKISPDYLPALEGAAQLEYKAGSVAAIPLLQHVLQLHPRDPTSHAMLAVLYGKRGDCASAVQHFELGGSLLDSQPGALQQYGACLARLKQLDKAISVFRRLLALDSANHDTRHHLATVQLMAKRPEDAIETLAPLLQESDPDSKTLQLAASAYEAGGDTPKAVGLLRRAIVSDPRNVALYLDFASISMDHQSFPAGAVSLQPGLGAAHNLLAKLYLQAGQNREAIAESRRALNIDPKDQTAVYHLIQALRKTGDKTELPELLQRLAELRRQATKQEEQRNRYKLIEGNTPQNQPAQP